MARAVARFAASPSPRSTRPTPGPPATIIQRIARPSAAASLAWSDGATACHSSLSRSTTSREPGSGA